MFSSTRYRPPAVIGLRVHLGKLPPKGLYSSVQWWHHFYVRPDPTLDAALRETVKHFANTRPYLLTPQIRGLAYDWLGIPNACGEINKRLWLKRIKLQLKTVKNLAPSEVTEALKALPLKIVPLPPKRSTYRIFKNKAAIASQINAQRLDSTLESMSHSCAEETSDVYFPGRQNGRSTYAPIYDNDDAAQNVGADDRARPANASNPPGESPAPYPMLYDEWSAC